MRIAIFGCGNMGLAYARSFVRYGIAEANELVLCGRTPLSESLQHEFRGAGFYTQVPAEKLKSCKAVIIAVKPQDFATLVPELRGKLAQDSLLISIMAGRTLEELSTSLEHQAVVRAMPNMPVQVGMGMTAYTAQGISMSQSRLVENLLNTTGRCVYLEEENLLDAVTAISGSGPAYFFSFINSLTEAGKQLGLEGSIAELLARQTMLGAYHIMNSSGKSPEELIKAVASKGGTTEAAFREFHAGRFDELIHKAVAAAQKRAAELGQSVHMPIAVND